MKTLTIISLLLEITGYLIFDTSCPVVNVWRSLFAKFASVYFELFLSFDFSNNVGDIPSNPVVSLIVYQYLPSYEKLYIE